MAADNHQFHCLATEQFGAFWQELERLEHVKPDHRSDDFSNSELVNQDAVAPVVAVVDPGEPMNEEEHNVDFAPSSSDENDEDDDDDESSEDHHPLPGLMQAAPLRFSVANRVQTDDAEYS